MVAYALIGIAFMQVAITLVSQRETGQLKRYRGTPVPAWTFIVATVLRAAAMAVSVTAIRFSSPGLPTAWTFRRRRSPRSSYVALGTATLCSAGIVATTVVPDGERQRRRCRSRGAAVVHLVDLRPGRPAARLAGDVGRIFPLYHVAVGVQTALAPPATSSRGGDVAVLVAWALGAVIIAARGFRWEPRAAAA